MHRNDGALYSSHIDKPADPVNIHGIPTAIISLTPRIGDVAGVPSMVIHLMGLIIGSVFAVVFRKSLQGFFDKEKALKNAEFVNTPQTV